MKQMPSAITEARGYGSRRKAGTTAVGGALSLMSLALTGIKSAMRPAIWNNFSTCEHFMPVFGIFAMADAGRLACSLGPETLQNAARIRRSRFAANATHA
jgi:hypothetical protein